MFSKACRNIIMKIPSTQSDVRSNNKTILMEQTTIELNPARRRSGDVTAVGQWGKVSSA